MIEIASPMPAVMICGLSGAGKTTLAGHLRMFLHSKGVLAEVLDPSIVYGSSREKGRPVATLASHGKLMGILIDAAVALSSGGVVPILSAVFPSKLQREEIKSRFGARMIYEIYVSTPLNICMQRDPKGLYEGALMGTILSLPGANAPFDVPSTPNVRVDRTNVADRALPSDLTEDLIRWLNQRGVD